MMTDRLVLTLSFKSYKSYVAACWAWEQMGIMYRTDYTGPRRRRHSTPSATFTDPEIYIMAKMAI